MKNNCPKILWVAVLIPVSFGILATNTRSQDLIKSSVFVFARPGSARAGAGKAAGKPASDQMYRKHGQLAPRGHKTGPVKALKQTDESKPGAAGSPANVEAAEKLGITLWRLRPERAGDTGARLLTMNGSSKDSSKLVAERVPLDTVFQTGDKVRLSVESPQTGYLYIIDRELHKDNTIGEANLIFPTLKTRGGDNSVSGGKVIEIPAQADSQPYFDITPNDANYAGELLTVIVSKKKIEGLVIKNGPLVLSTVQVEEWENLWERTATTFELDKGRDLAYTEDEREAGAGNRQLTQMSPSPQTLISVDNPQEKAFLISFAMKVAK